MLQVARVIRKVARILFPFCVLIMIRPLNQVDAGYPERGHSLNCLTYAAGVVQLQQLEEPSAVLGEIRGSNQDSVLTAVCNRAVHVGDSIYGAPRYRHRES